MIQRSKRHFKRNLMIVAPVCLFAKVIIVLLAMGVSRAEVTVEPSANGDDAALRKRVEKIVEDYLRDRSEVIEQAIVALETKRLTEEKERAKAAIAARRNELLGDPGAGGKTPAK